MVTVVVWLFTCGGSLSLGGNGASLVRWRPLNRVSVVVGRDRELVLSPESVAVASGLSAPELSVLRAFPPRFLAPPAVVVHVDVVLARVVFRGVEGRVRVEDYVLPPFIEEHHVCVCLGG